MRRNSEPDLALEKFRNYLCVLAGLHMDSALQAKMAPSDIVQITMMKAHEARTEFCGHTPEEMAAWLRQILVRTLADAGRDLRRAKRDMGKERSLQAALDHSSYRLEGLMAIDQVSPSQQAARNELFLHLADALSQLPEPQRKALLMKHCQGLSLVEVGKAMGRSTAAVASLLRRGLSYLRQHLIDLE